jgi:uncharacterized protein YuzE
MTIITINPQKTINKIEEVFKIVLPHSIFDLRYDPASDVLGIRFCEYPDSISDAIDDEGMIIGIYDPKTDEIVGLEILNLKIHLKGWKIDKVTPPKV